MGGSSNCFGHLFHNATPLYRCNDVTLRLILSWCSFTDDQLVARLYGVSKININKVEDERRCLFGDNRIGSARNINGGIVDPISAIAVTTGLADEYV